MAIPLQRYWTLLRTYLRPLWPRVLLLALVLAGSIGLQLYNPRVLARFIDAAGAGRAAAELTALAALFLGLALANQALAVLATYISQDVGWRATNELRADLTLHCLRLDLSFHKARTPGELIERVDGDVTALANFFSQFVVMVLANAVLLAGILAVLFRVDWRAGLALGGFAAVNMALLLRLRNVAVGPWQAARQAAAEFFGYLQERLSGTEDIRANGAEAHALRGFDRLMRSRVQAERRAGVAQAVVMVVTFGLLAVGMATAFAVSAWLVTAGSITVGTAYMIFFYTELLRRPTEQITTQIQDLGRAGASIGRIAELLDTRSRLREGSGTPPAAGMPAGEAPVGGPPAGGMSPAGGPPAVRVDGVSFGYDGGAPVLHDVSFELRPGQVLGLLGRTGSGKTSLARLLARLYDPDRGAVRLSGADLRDLRLDDLRRRVGVVTQDVQLFRGTVRENLALFDPAISDGRLLAALAELGLDDWLRAFSRGLDTELAAGGAGLSAGEAQLLALARVFLRDPGLVILDEASARLDPATEERIERALDRLLRGRTAVIIAHRLRTVGRADLIMVLEGGRSLEFGPRRALATDPASHFHRLLQAGLEEVLA